MSNKFSSLNEFLESLLDGREIQLKYGGKEYCIFNMGADNGVEKSKIWVGEGNAEESFVEYSNIDNFIEIYQINGRKIKDIQMCIRDRLHTAYSIFRKDPLERTIERGYVLE